MTIQLNWPPVVVNHLTEEARQRGLSLDDYVLQTVLQQKGSNGAPTADEVLTPAEAKKVRHALKQIREGKTHPWSQIKHELGL